MSESMFEIVDQLAAIVFPCQESRGLKFTEVLGLDGDGFKPCSPKAKAIGCGGGEDLHPLFL